MEVEIPVRGSHVESLKGAMQWTLGRFGGRGQWIHAIQLIAEHPLGVGRLDVSPIYVLGHRISRPYSYLLMAGVLSEVGLGAGQPTALIPLLNGAFFYNYSEQIDLALEVNLTGLADSYRFLRVIPQLHLLLRPDWKIQMGFGAIQKASQWHATSAFRLIKEFND